MKNMREYLNPVEPQLYSKRDGTLGSKTSALLSQTSEKDLLGKYILLGVPDDRGVKANGGNPGAAAGPGAFRTAFYKLYDTVLREYCPRTHGPLPMCQSNSAAAKNLNMSACVVDAGDIKLVDDLAQTHDVLAEAVSSFLKRGAEMIFIVGGGHDFSYGSYTGHAAAMGGIIPIINLDAHFDLRPVEGGIINSGTPFYRVIENKSEHILGGRALLELGLQRERNPQFLYDYALKKRVSCVEYLNLMSAWRNVYTGRDSNPLEHVFDHLDSCAHLGWNRRDGSVHVSLDLDVFSSSVAPGTSAATPCGVTLAELGPVLSYFGRSRLCRVFDIAELCPTRDLSDQTARLAAAIVFKSILLREEYAAR